MNIVQLTDDELAAAAPLAAAFRVALKTYKGISAAPDINAGKDELAEYLQANYPIFAAIRDQKYVGYIVCRVEEPTVWIESIYVIEEYRRTGIASALLHKAEELANSYGENTVFNYVHPNNDAMIAFLKKHDYTVLNLIEIRKAFPGEKLSTKIYVGNNQFDY